MTDNDPQLTRRQHEQFDANLDLDELRDAVAHTRDINNMRPEPKTRFSLPWKQKNADLWQAGPYAIVRDGWHDTGKTMQRWVLRFQGTLVHTGSGFGGDDVRECMAKADWHRGIG